MEKSAGERGHPTGGAEGAATELGELFQIHDGAGDFELDVDLVQAPVSCSSETVTLFGFSDLVLDAKSEEPAHLISASASESLHPVSCLDASPSLNHLLGSVKRNRFLTQQA